MGLYVSKHIEKKNLNPAMLLINLIKNLLLISFFFIITYKLIYYDYIGVSIGFAIMPLSVFLALVLRLINND
jgi:retron-type reverse transcriptase